MSTDFFNDAYIASLTKTIGQEVLAQGARPAEKFATESSTLAPTSTKSISRLVNDQPQGQTRVLGDAGPTRQAARRHLNRVRPDREVDHGALTETLGQRLVYARLTRGYTQKAVAGKILVETKSGKRPGVLRPLSRNAYCTYELGSTEPSLDIIQKLATILRVAPGWIAFGS